MSRMSKRMRRKSGKSRRVNRKSIKSKRVKRISRKSRKLLKGGSNFPIPMPLPRVDTPKYKKLANELAEYLGSHAAGAGAGAGSGSAGYGPGSGSGSAGHGHGPGSGSGSGSAGHGHGAASRAASNEEWVKELGSTHLSNIYNKIKADQELGKKFLAEAKKKEAAEAKKKEAAEAKKKADPSLVERVKGFFGKTPPPAPPPTANDLIKMKQLTKLINAAKAKREQKQQKIDELEGRTPLILEYLKKAIKRPKRDKKINVPQNVWNEANIFFDSDKTLSIPCIKALITALTNKLSKFFPDGKFDRSDEGYKILKQVFQDNCAGGGGPSEQEWTLMKILHPHPTAQTAQTNQPQKAKTESKKRVMVSE
jgi:hypothetical protein